MKKLIKHLKIKRAQTAGSDQKKNIYKTIKKKIRPSDCIRVTNRANTVKKVNPANVLQANTVKKVHPANVSHTRKAHSASVPGSNSQRGVIVSN